MSKVLEPGAQKLIDTQKVISQEGQQFTYEIVINGAVQKDSYEKLLATRMKDVEVKGFRKGEAPREMAEPKVYDDVIKDVINLLVNYAVEELLAEEEIIATTGPEVDKVDFVMVETPLKFTVKINKLPNYKLPNTKKLKVKNPDVSIDEKDIKTARENLWTEWLKKAKDEDKKEFTELNDAWVEKHLGIPKVTTVKELDGLLKHELEHSKLHQEEDRLVGESLDKAIEMMKIEVPANVTDATVERNMKAQEEQFKKYGITFQDYLKHYKKTEEEYKQEIIDSSEKKFKEDVFWTLFIKDRKIKIDPKDPKDIVFVNYAASAMKIKPDAKLSRQQVDAIMQTSAMYKAVQVFREEIGLKSHEEPVADFAAPPTKNDDAKVEEEKGKKEDKK